MASGIESNRPLLRFYQTAARVVGWVLLGAGGVWLVLFVLGILACVIAAGEMRWSGAPRNVAYSASTFALSFAIPGVLALMLAQLIAHVLDREGRPGWILRHGTWFLYGCALVLVGQATVNLADWGLAVSRDPDRAGLLFIGPTVVPLLAKVLVCVGLGHVLGRVLPIIDESKALV
jgi:hypothetical protein